MQERDSTTVEVGGENAGDLVHEFLGAAHMSASAMLTVLEEDLLRDASYGHLTVLQPTLLELLSLSESLPVGDTAAFWKVSKAAASKAVDKLVRKMYLQRSHG